MIQKLPVHKLRVLFFMVCAITSCSGKQEQGSSSVKRLDIAGGTIENVIVLDAPDPIDESTQRAIILPEFEKFCHIAADSVHFRWIGASNRMFPWVGANDLNGIFNTKSPTPPRIPNANRRALTMLFKLKDGKYLTLLPLSGAASVSWLQVTEQGTLEVDYGTLGTETTPSDGKIPLLAWYKSENVYESIAKTWSLSLENDAVAATASLRSAKRYPEPFEYLGWCTYEQYKKDIDESTLLKAIDNIERSEVPVRWFLIDDGHQDDKDRKLLSFTPNRDKFPNGWDPIVSRKSEAGLRWMGIWHGFLSHWQGVHVDHSMEELSPFLMHNPSRENGLLPKDDMESSTAFYEYLVTTIKLQGFDFMKTDNVSRSTIEYYGSENPARAQRQNVLALEDACLEAGIGLMNCSAQNTIDMLNARNSATMRTSPDYIKNDLATSKSQILQSVFNVLWLGQTLWPDHDMFHSSDTQVGEAMSVTKAMSGGPIYLSDDPVDFNMEVINPLYIGNGRLIRPEAPAVPLPESIFNDALYEGQSVYKTIAPLKNKSCAIVAYNLSMTASGPLAGTIGMDDYSHAPAMMQPYSDRWNAPEEGLVIYDWNNQSGHILGDEGENFQINGFGHRLFLIAPIEAQWAVIGRPDKYLSPSTVEILDNKEDSITVRMQETGPLVLYSAKGEPTSEYFFFSDMGSGFYRGEPAQSTPEDQLYKISR